MNVSTSALGVRRRKATSQNIDEEENAAVLKLGPEFQLQQMTNSGDTEQLIALNLSEARLLIRAALKERKNKTARGQQPPVDVDNEENEKEDEISNMELAGPNSNEIMHKTLNYLANFARFKNSSSVETVEKLLTDFSASASEPLHPFELAQLGSLECEEAEEAKSLIPSLAHKVSDVQLQTLLTELRKYQTLS